MAEGTRKKAVIDRVEEGWLVLHLDGEKEERLLPKERPWAHLQEGDRVNVTLDAEQRVIAVHLDQEETERLRREIEERLKLLQQRKKSRFKRRG